jgi:hypothetical protein
MLAKQFGKTCCFAAQKSRRLRRALLAFADWSGRRSMNAGTVLLCRALIFEDRPRNDLKSLI